MTSRNKWLLANVVGMVVYLLVASALWVRPENQGQPGGPGDGFYWFMAVVPIGLGFAITNLVALVIFLRQYRVSKSSVSLLVLAVVVLAWGNVLLYDHIRAVRYIDSKYAQQSIQPDGLISALGVTIPYLMGGT